MVALSAENAVRTQKAGILFFAGCRLFDPVLTRA